nr:transposase [uncultured Chryseobacterium sp.]
MKLDFKNIHIGQLIEWHVKENTIDTTRICRFLECSDMELKTMYEQESFSIDLLLKWSKLLEYDFFRIYSQHLILFAPPQSAELCIKSEPKKQTLPYFKKSLYTRELIDFILELIITRKKTKSQIIDEYRIPKTTLHRWVQKYQNTIQNNT